MNSKELKVAVLMATYNGEKYIDKQIKSLLEQTYNKYKIYISDDGSTDDTRNILEYWVNAYPDKIIIVENSIEKKGVVNNFFNLIEKVNADVYFFCDQDDVWKPEKIDIMVNHYLKQEVVVPCIIYCDMQVVDENLNRIRDSIQKDMNEVNRLDWKRYLFSNNIAGCSMMVNDQLLNIWREEKYTINLENIIMHDYFLVLIAVFTGEVLYLDNILNLYRQHTNNMVGVQKNNFVALVIDKFKICQKHEYLKRCEMQVAELLKLKEIKKVDIVKYELLRGFADLYYMNKLGRVRFAIKNKLIYGNVLNYIYQLLKF